MPGDEIPDGLRVALRQIAAEHHPGGEMFVASAPESVPQSEVAAGDTVVYVQPPAGSAQAVDDQTIVAVADGRTGLTFARAGHNGTPKVGRVQLGIVFATIRRKPRNG